MKHSRFLHIQFKIIGTSAVIIISEEIWGLRTATINIRLVDITAGGDFLGLCDQKSSYKHVSDFGRLRSYGRLKLKIEGNDY